jgi:membrane protein YdbS with pleckstrin-like domain
MPVIPCPDCQRDVSPLAPACPHCGRPSPAGNAPIPAYAAPVAEEHTVWRGSPAWTLLLGHIAGIVLTLIGVPLLTWLVSREAMDIEAATRVNRTGWAITAVLLLIQLIVFAIAFLRLRSTMYTVTNQRVMIETGLIAKALSEIDLRYVDDTAFTQGVVARILGIGNVTLVSSDKTTPVFILRSIRDPRSVRELIRSHAYKVSQRQVFTRAT